MTHSVFGRRFSSRFVVSSMFPLSLPRYAKLLVSAASVVGGLVYVKETRWSAQQISPSTASADPASTGFADSVGSLWTRVQKRPFDMIPSTLQDATGGLVKWLWALFDKRAHLPREGPIDDGLQKSAPYLPSHRLLYVQRSISLMQGKDEAARIAAMKGLMEFASSSLGNTDLLAAQKIGPVMTRLFDDASKHRTAFSFVLNKLATVLLENAPRLDVLEAEKWVRPLIVLLADHLALDNTAQMTSILATLTALSQTGHRRVTQAFKRSSSSLWTILKRIRYRENPEIQRHIASLLRSLSNAGLRPEGEEQALWEELLLEWVMSGTESLRHAASWALTDMVSEAASISLAKKWLSHIIITLSLSSLLQPSPADTPAEAEPWVIPSYMRYVADEIAGHVPPSDPPEYSDMHHTTSFLEPLMLDWEEDDSDETAISRGISILCDFAADNAELCDWLMRVNVLMPCHMLMQQKTLTVKEQQQMTRLIALLSRTHFEGSCFVSWLPWLQRRVESSDLLLSSHAVRSLIHIHLGQAGDRHRCPTFPDGIHFFNPHLRLSEDLTVKQSIEDGTVADVVFVHGIRGGPYLTWRSEGTSEMHHSRDVCWPSHWLAEDIPQARLITVQFAAPVSSWEGGSGPLQHTAQQLLERLREAGIGRRPLIFVAHSMGGLIVKELLCQAMDDTDGSEMAKNTRGMVFISTPHHGTLLARVAWGLRYFGACPAPSLNLMKPGPYLEQLNVQLRDWVKKRSIRVLSFAETLSTDVLSMIPKLRVVGLSSAFPGYGSSVRLEGVDHINSCKPKCRTDAFYRHFVVFLKEVVETCL